MTGIRTTHQMDNQIQRRADADREKEQHELR